MVYGHAKAIGASEGPVVLQRWARPWAPLFSRPSPTHLLPFLRGLLESPGSDAGGLAAEAVAAFGPMMMGAAGRVVMAAAAAAAAPAPGDDGGVSGNVAAAVLNEVEAKKSVLVSEADAGRALGLLVDICDVSAATTAGPGWGMLRAQTLPLLLTAQPAGVRLAALIRRMASPPAGGLLADNAESKLSHAAVAAAAATPGKRQKSAAPVAGRLEPVGSGAGPLSGSSVDAADEVHRLWCAVQLLPHACESPEQAVEACQAVLTAVESAMEEQEGANAGPAGKQQQQQDVLLLLHGTATRMLATLLPSMAAGEPGEGGLAEAAEASLAWLMRHPLSYWSARAAGAMLAAAREQHPPPPHQSAPSGNRGPSSSAGSGGKAGGLQKLLSEASLRSALPPLLPLLSSRSQAVRAAALGVLSAFDTPVLLPLESDVAAGRTGTPMK